MTQFIGLLTEKSRSWDGLEERPGLAGQWCKQNVTLFPSARSAFLSVCFAPKWAPPMAVGWYQQLPPATCFLVPVQQKQKARFPVGFFKGVRELLFPSPWQVEMAFHCIGLY